MSSIARRIASLGLYDPDVTAWVLAVRTAGASVSVARARQVSTLVNALKAANIWNSLDRLWLHAAENSTQALIDLKARATATAVNSPTFTADRGFTGNGTTSYIDSNFNASTAGGNFTQNNAGMGAWCETYSGAGGGVLIGNNESAYSRIMLIATTRESSCNTGSAPTTYAISVNTGFLMAQRTGASAHAAFLNGVSEYSDTKTSTALINQTGKILANVTSGGTITRFAPHRVAMSFFGASLAGKEAAFYGPVRTYMTAVGVA